MSSSSKCPFCNTPFADVSEQTLIRTVTLCTCKNPRCLYNGYTLTDDSWVDKHDTHKQLRRAWSREGVGFLSLEIRRGSQDNVVVAAQLLDTLLERRAGFVETEELVALQTTLLERHGKVIGRDGVMARALESVLASVDAIRSIRDWSAH